MKYINSHYSLFDTCDFSKFFLDTDNGGGFSSGEGKITLPAANAKLYVSFELHSTGTSSSNCWPLQIYFSDGTYNSTQLSTVQIQYDGANNLIYLKTGSTERARASFSANIWHKIYLIIDSVSGTIDFYVDGSKISTFADYVKTGVKAICCKIKLVSVSASLCTKMRNLIISDDYFPPNETIILIPATITANGFTSDNGKYSTAAENSNLQIQPDLSVLDGYKVTAVNVGIGSSILGDTIKKIQCSTENFSTTKEIPATGKGMYFEGLPTTNITKITLTSKK